jgi:hypothetical protein
MPAEDTAVGVGLDSDNPVDITETAGAPLGAEAAGGAFFLIDGDPAQAHYHLPPIIIRFLFLF